MDSESATAEVSTADILRILEMIPHRYPFLMIDRIIEMNPDDSAVAIKNVSINEPFFQGHFPAQPVMPGVLIIEAMAQAAGVLVVHTMGSDAEGKLVYFMSIDQARFRKPITPGDQVHIHVKKQQSRGNVWKFKGEARVDGSVMAEATYAAMIVDS